MTLLEFRDLLAVMNEAGVQSASVDIFGAKVAVAFEPRLPPFNPEQDEPLPGGWKQASGQVTSAAPPQELDLPMIWGDAPRSKE